MTSLDTDWRRERRYFVQVVDFLAWLGAEGDVSKPRGISQGLCREVGPLLARGNVYRGQMFSFDLGDEANVFGVHGVMGRPAQAIVMAA